MKRKCGREGREARVMDGGREGDRKGRGTKIRREGRRESMRRGKKVRLSGKRKRKEEKVTAGDG